MIEIKTYICGICGAQYNDKIQCERCVNSHKKPVEIVGASYCRTESKHLGYPARVRIKMSNGSVREYNPCREE